MAREAVKARERKRAKLVAKYAAKRAELKANGDAVGLDKLPNAIQDKPRQWGISDWADLRQMDVFKQIKI